MCKLSILKAYAEKRLIDKITCNQSAHSKCLWMESKQVVSRGCGSLLATEGSLLGSFSLLLNKRWLQELVKVTVYAYTIIIIINHCHYHHHHLKVFDGWILKGEKFPSSQDHPLPTMKRYTDFCESGLTQRSVRSSQNVAMVFFRIHEPGNGFTLTTKTDPNLFRK